MSTYSPDLVWGCVRTTNAFLRKGRFPNVAFSCEPGNLTGKHSYKASGLANKKTVDIQPAEGGALKLTTTVEDFDAVSRKVRRRRAAARRGVRVTVSASGWRRGQAACPSATGARPRRRRSRARAPPRLCGRPPLACFPRSPSR